jgi:phosphopentomutase
MAGKRGLVMIQPKRRAIWIVLDGVGLEASPDAGEYGDDGAATLPHVAQACGGLRLPNLGRLGLGNLVNMVGVPPLAEPLGAYGRLTERAAGKDSIVGHWELAGVVLDRAFATYPQGFPDKLVAEFTEIAGKPPLGNVPASGVSIIGQYGAEHVRTGRPILYTSVDSVFQIAAHEDIIPPEELYRLCRSARNLVDGYDIARVIARPFVGDAQQGFRRSPRRKDFSMPPPQATLLDCLTGHGFTVSAVGKISDLFAGRGISRSTPTLNNADGMNKILRCLDDLDSGLLMANLIDFDMIYGHRNDAVGFGRALEEFDAWLPRLYTAMRPDDLLVVCADHGCDPTSPGTDHTREYVPLLIWAKSMRTGVSLGRRKSFSDVAATLATYFMVSGSIAGESFAELLRSTGAVSF